MATPWQEMIDEFKRDMADGPFETCARYDEDSDALTVFFSNVPEHGRRLNSRVTVYLADDTEELVGCRVKGVKTAIEDIGSFDIAISHGKIKLTLLFAALHGKFEEGLEGRDWYRRLARTIGRSDLELDLPEPAAS